MAIFKTRKVDVPAAAKASKAPWGPRAHVIKGRDVGVKVDREGRVKDTVDWAMPADFTYTDSGGCQWGDDKGERKSKVDRGKCWIQLAFLEGKPHLRVCRKNNQDGAVIPVSSPTEARTLGRQLCRDYEAAKGDWAKFKKSLPKNYKLGAAPAKTRSTKKTSATYCVVGTGGRKLRCFKSKSAATKYRKRRCGTRKGCKLKVRAS